MEPDETKSIQQAQPPTLKQDDTIPQPLHIAGISPLLPQSANEFGKTKSIQQPQSPNLNQIDSKATTLQIGLSPLPQQSSSGEFNSQPSFWSGLRLPAKRVGTILFLLLILILIGSGLFNLAKGVIDSLIAKPAITNQPTEQSQPTTTNSSTTVTSDKNNCTDLPTRMTTAKITSQQVDNVFYQTYPDRVNKPLADASTDKALRQQWCTVANKLIKEKSSK